MGASPIIIGNFWASLYAYKYIPKYVMQSALMTTGFTGIALYFIIRSLVLAEFNLETILIYSFVILNFSVSLVSMVIVGRGGSKYEGDKLPEFPPIPPPPPPPHY